MDETNTETEKFENKSMEELLYEETVYDPELPAGYKKVYCYLSEEKKRCAKKDAYYCIVFIYDENGKFVIDYTGRIIKNLIK